jgi:Uma2 family endonuclease
MRRKFTVDEYHRMAEAGILGEDDRVELIDGEIVQVSPIGSTHAACVARLNMLLSPLQARGIVWVQNPIRLGDYAEPEPDVAVLRPRGDFYAGAHPGPQDVLLIVEVAETSADRDRAVKVPLYARWGIREVWLVDLERSRIEVYRSPSPRGYQDTRVAGRGEQLSPAALPDFSVSSDDVLG